MGTHIDTRGQRRKKVRSDDDLARRRRASFKQYLRDLDEALEDDLLEDELDELSTGTYNQDE